MDASTEASKSLVASETQPLLSCPIVDGDAGGEAFSTEQDAQSATPPVAERRKHLVLLLLLVLASLDFGVFVMDLPLTRVYESIACYHHYKTDEPGRFDRPDSIPEHLCKVPAVQTELAEVRGFELLFMTLPGVLLAFPYGMLADRLGRRVVLRLSLLGLCLALIIIQLVCRVWWVFPLRLVWLAWSMTIIGGGAPVLASTLYTMLADALDQNQRARVFLRMSVIILAAQACAVPLASQLMARYGPDTPLTLGWTISFAGCIQAAFAPETKKNPYRTLAAIPTNDREARLVPSEVAEDTLQPAQTSRPPWYERHVATIRNELGVISGSASLFLLILTLFFDAFAFSSIYIVAQFASTRFSIPISTAGLLLVTRAPVSLMVLLLVIPGLGRFLENNYDLTGPVRDLWLTRLTLMFVPLGFVFLMLAGNMAMAAVGLMLTALGAGCNGLSRSVASGMVSNDKVARLFAIISIAEGLGTLLGGPGVARIFSFGLKLGGGWVSLPFAVVSCLTAISTAIMFVIRARSL